MKQALFFPIVLFLLIIIGGVLQATYTLYNKKDLIKTMDTDIAKEEKRQQTLLQKIRVSSTSAYVEEQARDKLLMVYPGERVVILITPTSAPTPTPQPYKKVLDWFNQFFH